ncbi:hypothetical protein Tco_0726548 [Tanacetum coccineum]|uniref:Reverse transcriptase Ty1/copia-type domain-containing protein n=1 Tax=Tanacetum coccineum TaxID=301880 RepID=A0ABQ4YGS7_9ASTR
MLSTDSVNTLMVDKSKLDKDLQGKPVEPTHYRGMIDSLMYLTAIKRIFQYLKGTIDKGLWYSKDSSNTLTAYADANHVGCQDTRQSTSGFVLKSFGCDHNKTDYGFKFNKIPLYCDNKSAIALCCNNVQYSRSKHIDVRYHFIKDLVKVAYDRYAVWGVTHWGLKRQRFYGFASNMVSKHDVYSTKKIIAVTHVKVIKWYDYGHLEEIEVRREDQKLYKFKEGDFLRLNLRDIEGMLLLLMFTKRVVILKRVKDLQLGVESYQKKLNITRPETFMSDISKRTPYTAYNNPQDIIYLDKYKRNRLMYSDELYKFYDVTLTFVRTVLHDITSNPRMDYLPKRRWSNLDRKRYMYSFPRSIQNQRDLPRDILLVRIEVLSRHEPSDAMRNPPQPLKKDSILQAGNHVKEILLKLNLPDHRSILMDSKIYVKTNVEVPGSNTLKDS